MATQTQTPAPAGNVFKGVAKKSVYNLDTLQREPKEQPFEVQLSQSAADLSKYDEKSLLAIVQIGEKRKALLDAKAKIEGVDASLISKTIAPLRLFPMFSSDAPDLYDSKDEKGQPVLNRKLQTARIMGWLKSMPQMWDQLVAAAKAANADEDNEEADTED